MQINIAKELNLKFLPRDKNVSLAVGISFKSFPEVKIIEISIQ